MTRLTQSRHQRLSSSLQEVTRTQGLVYTRPPPPWPWKVKPAHEEELLHAASHTARSLLRGEAAHDHRWRHPHIPVQY